MGNRWTQKEIDILSSNYGVASKGEIVGLFPNRSYKSIISAAYRYGFSAPNNFWSESEVSLLEDLYEDNLNINTLLPLFPGRSSASIGYKANELGLRKNRSKIRKKIKVNFSFFDVPSVLNSYWAGFIAADGCISPETNRVKLVLATKDKAHLCRFKEDCLFGGLIRDAICGPKSFKPGATSSGMSVNGVPEWKKALKENFNIGPRKTYDLMPPELDLKCSLSYIVGFCDGDGWIYEDRSNFRMGFVGRFQVLSWIKSLFDFIVPPINNRVASVTKINREGYKSLIYNYVVGGRRGLNLLRSLLSFGVPRMRRKWEPVAERLKLSQVLYSF